MLKINDHVTPKALLTKINRLFELSGPKILKIQTSWNPARGAPVFTERGVYTSRGWTEWTQGFQFGAAILQFDAIQDPSFLEIGKRNTIEFMAAYVSHMGMHDHGFNIISTYGNLHRLLLEGRFPANSWEKHVYELALKTSGAVQASRWTRLPEFLGYIYSFNGCHSLFADAIRTLRVLAVSHQLGQVLMAEKGQPVSLLKRLLQHTLTTARYNVYYGDGRDVYDVRGRVAHEAIFDPNDGSYRCSSSQQGYSPFSTWTRGLAWVILGFAEQLEFLDTLRDSDFAEFRLGAFSGKDAILARLKQVAQATADFYLSQTPVDGIPYWDTGAPGLTRLGHYLDRPADPFNDYEPVDSSAAVITAQGLIRLGNFLMQAGETDRGTHYLKAGLTIADTVFDEPYLCTDENHQGLILHSVYHRPHNWDYMPQGKKIPCGESSMWGDYHALELALLLKRLAREEPYYAFFIRG